MWACWVGISLEYGERLGNAIGRLLNERGGRVFEGTYGGSAKRVAGSTTYANCDSLMSKTVGLGLCSAARFCVNDDTTMEIEQLNNNDTSVYSLSSLHSLIIQLQAIFTLEHGPLIALPSVDDLAIQHPHGQSYTSTATLTLYTVQHYQ